MNRYTQHWRELNAPREPSTLAIVAGAAFALLALWCVTAFLFSL